VKRFEEAGYLDWTPDRQLKPGSRFFERRVADYLGCDIAQSDGGVVDLICAATHIPLADQSRDTVFSTQVIEHVADHRRLVSEAYRVLKPGGVFRIWDVELPVSPDPKQDLAIFKFTFRLPAETVETGYGTSFPITPLQMSHFERLLTAAGFALDTRHRDGRVLTIVAIKH
jgi:SAM-dependent methyltransferase